MRVIRLYNDQAEVILDKNLADVIEGAGGRYGRVVRQILLSTAQIISRSAGETV